MASTVVRSVQTTAAELVESLAAIQVFPAEMGWELSSEYANESNGGDAIGFCQYLVRKRILTQFQADRINGGELNRLTMGPYLIQEPIGTGTLGTILKAVHRENQQLFAMKVLPLRSIWHVHLAKKLVHMFTEIPAHPGVIPLTDIDTANGSHYLAWPFEKSESLEKFISKRGPLPISEAIRVAVSVAEAIAFCHRHGIVHGCINPGTILIADDGTAKICEWGIGAILSENIADDESFLDTISTATAVSQNLDYAPPETISDPTCRTATADQYAFGCTLYSLLTGMPPFPSGNLVDKMIAHQTYGPVPISTRNPRVPDALSDVVNRLMQKSPGDRYPDWLEPIAALRMASGLLTTPPRNIVSIPAREIPFPDLEPVNDDSLPTAENHIVYSEIMTARPANSRQRDVNSESEITFDIDQSDENTENSFGINGGRPRVGSTGEIPQIEVAPEVKKTIDTPAPSGPIAPIVLTGKKSAFIGSVTNKEEQTKPSKKSSRRKFSFKLPSPVTHRAPANGTVEQMDATVSPPAGKVGIYRWLRSKVLGTPVPESLQISIFGPKNIATGQTIRVQTFAHSPLTFESMKTLARAFSPDAELIATGFLNRYVERGGTLSFHLTVANAGVGDPYVTFQWMGQPTPIIFEIYVPWESSTGQTEAVLTTAIDNERTAVMPFQFTVVNRATSSLGSGVSHSKLKNRPV